MLSALRQQFNEDQSPFFPRGRESWNIKTRKSIKVFHSQQPPSCLSNCLTDTYVELKCVPGTVLSALQIPTHLIFLPCLDGAYYPYFPDEETGPQRG